VSYQWEILESPQGAVPSELSLKGQDGVIASFIPTIAGQYTVRLTVNNDQGLQSIPTEESDLTINGLANSGILIQLVWDHPSNNQDLHLVHLSSDGNFCSANGDCNPAEPSPIWFPEHEAATGPNPMLSRDDSDGYGPESITIDTPEAGTYRILTHYAPAPNSSGPTVQQIRVFIDGTLELVESRTLTGAEQIWAIADITWSDEQEATITPYPSDVEGEVGAVAIGDASACDGDEGWVFPN
jgi:PKD repeat protein